MTTPDQPKDDARSTGAPRPTTEQSSREQAPQQGGPVKPTANPLPPRPLPPTGQRSTQQGQGGPVRPSQSPPPPPVDRSQPVQPRPAQAPPADKPAAVTEAKSAAPSGSTTASQAEKPQTGVQQPNAQQANAQQAKTLNMDTPQQPTRPPTTSDRHVEGDDHLVASHEGPPRRAEHPLTGQNPAVAASGANAPAQAKNGGNPAPKAPPWQRGQQPQQPQNEPQSNLFRPGESPVAGRPPARAPRLTDGPATGNSSGPATAATTTAAGAAGVEAAKNARREAAKTKAAAIDGPTRKVARPELSKDMPDLSDVKHPLPETGGAVATKAAPTAVAAGSGQAAVAAPGEGLRATVQVRKIDPWSTLKVSLVISVALFFVWMVAVGLLYVVLDGMGVWDRLNSAFTDIVSESGSGGLITGGQVFGYAAVIGLINVVLFTALATIGSFIYNQCSDLVGGVQVTLADPD